MRVRRGLATMLAVSQLVAGCGGGWHAVPIGQSLAHERRQQYQVFHRGRVEQWHGLRVTADSVSGVPFIRPPDCDSCRLSLPRAEVDSVRAGDSPAGFFGSVGLVVFGGLMLMAIACGRSGCGGT